MMMHVNMAVSIILLKEWI